MKANGQRPGGRIAIDVEIVNNVDLVAARHGYLEAANVRRVTIAGLIDSNAMRLE